MTYKTCEDCGTRMEGGYCPNCNEEIFIEQQYIDEDMDIPENISQTACEQRNNPAKAYDPKY